MMHRVDSSYCSIVSVQIVQIVRIAHSQTPSLPTYSSRRTANQIYLFMFLKLFFFFLTLFLRMADSILYSLYMKSNLYKRKDAVNIDIESGQKVGHVKKRMYEPNPNRHSMYIVENDVGAFF